MGQMPVSRRIARFTTLPGPQGAADHHRRAPVSRLASTIAVIWRLASPYFRSEDRFAGRILLAAVIAIELSLVTVNVTINWWNSRFYNALQDRNWEALVDEITTFLMLAAAYVVLAANQFFLQQWL